MTKAKDAITLDEETRSRLARECAMLDRRFEKALAEEGMSQDASEWPEYIVNRLR